MEASKFHIVGIFFYLVIFKHDLVFQDSPSGLGRGDIRSEKN